MLASCNPTKAATPRGWVAAAPSRWLPPNPLACRILDNDGTMKVLNLRCQLGHGFEGWFASEDDFQDQTARALLCCPLCNDASITRLPSAPRLNLSGARAPEPAGPAAPSPSQDAMGGAAPAALQALWVKAVQQVMRDTEDVGERFPEEARRIHYGEAPHRGIRGQASTEDRAALAEEGIEVMPLPLPVGMKGPSH